MKRFAFFVIVGVFPLVFCSCLPVSKNPVLQGNGQTSITPYLGHWRVQTVRGTALPVTCDAVVISGATDIHQVTITDPSSSKVSKIRLATLNGVVYGSENTEDLLSWLIGKLVLSNNGNTLSIYGLNEDTMAAHVASNTISGKNYPLDGVNHAIIDEDVMNLRTYIIGHPNSFNATADVVLNKVP